MKSIGSVGVNAQFTLPQLAILFNSNKTSVC
jgi:hypothetical protein